MKEIQRIGLGRVKGIEWLDDTTLLFSSTAGVYRMNASTFDWSLIAEVGGPCSLSADSQLLALRQPRCAQVIDVNDGKVIWESPGEHGERWGVAISDDGRFAAFGEGEESVKVVTLETGEIRELRTESAFNGCVKILWSGDKLITANADGYMEVWGPNGERLFDEWKDIGVGRAMALCGERIFQADDYWKIFLRELDGTDVDAIALPDLGRGTKFRALAVSPCGEFLAAAADSLYIIRVEDSELIAKVPLECDEEGAVEGFGLAWSPNGESIAVLTGSDFNVGQGSYSHSIQVFSSKGELLGRCLDFIGAVLDLSIGGDKLAIAHEFGVDLWEGEERRRYLNRNTQAVAISPDGSKLLACFGGYENELQLIETATGEVLFQPKPLKALFHRAVFSPDGLHYAYAANKAEVRKVGRKTVVYRHKLLDNIHGVAFSGDGKRFAEVNTGGSFNIGEGARFKSVKSGWKLDSPISDVALSPDGEKMALAGASGTHLFDLQTERALEPYVCLEGDGYGCTCVAWSPDGATVADGSADGQVRIWDVKDGKLLGQALHGSKVNNLAFGTDGRLYSASDDGTARVFQLG